MNIEPYAKVGCVAGLIVFIVFFILPGQIASIILLCFVGSFLYGLLGFTKNDDNKKE